MSHAMRRNSAVHGLRRTISRRIATSTRRTRSAGDGGGGSYSRMTCEEVMIKDQVYVTPGCFRARIRGRGAARHHQAPTFLAGPADRIENLSLRAPSSHP